MAQPQVSFLLKLYVSKCCLRFLRQPLYPEIQAGGKAFIQNTATCHIREKEGPGRFCVVLYTPAYLWYLSLLLITYWSELIIQLCQPTEELGGQSCPLERYRGEELCGDAGKQNIVQTAITIPTNKVAYNLFLNIWPSRHYKIVQL